MSTRWVVEQLLSFRREDESLRLHLRNQGRVGVLVPGSATDLVLRYLESHLEGWYSRRQIMAATGRTDKAVDWALLYLRHIDRVECQRADARNPRYLRYRAKRTDR